MSIQLSENESRVRYTLAQGVSQSVFAVPFEFFEDGDLTVFVDTVAKVEGADYTVSGGSGSTGSVTFLVALVGASGGSEIVIVRRIPVERVTDFLAGSDINRAALNEQLDTLTAMVADSNDKISLSLRANDFDNPLSFVFPEAAQRANTYLTFDAVGDVSLSSGLNTSVVISPFAESLFQKTNDQEFLNGLNITSSPSELNILDGVTGIVETTGNQSVAGVKTFTDSVTVNGVLQATSLVGNGAGLSELSILLGVINTTSGAVQTLSGLNLTGYRFLLFAVVGVGDGSASSADFRVGGIFVGPTLTDPNMRIYSTIYYDLETGGGYLIANASTITPATTTVSARNFWGQTSITTASTSIAADLSANTFVSGYIRIYGVK
jgi:hypothetical protein